MTATLIGYARCSTDRQDPAAQRQALLELGVAEDRIYTDHGTTRARPGLDQALAAVRAGDTLVVPKLDRLARSVPDARAIADRLRERGVKLALGRALYDPGDPMGKLFFNILATFAEFETDLKTNRLSHTQPATSPLAYDPAPYRNRPVHLVGDGDAGPLGPDGPRVLTGRLQRRVGSHLDRKGHFPLLWSLLYVESESVG